MENLDQQIRKKAITNGLILGVITLVLTITTYYLIVGGSASLLVIFVIPVLFSFIVPIIAAIILCVNLRKYIGGYWVFRQATTGVFIMFLVAFLVSSIGKDLIFAKFVEPDMTEKTENAMINATETMLKQNNVDQTQIDDKIDEIKKGFQGKENLSAGKVVLNYAIALIFLFVIALMFGAMFKKTPLKSAYDPEPTNPTV